MTKEGNYRHTIKCRKCKKRKVYIEESGDKFIYICKACGETWDA